MNHSLHPENISMEGSLEAILQYLDNFTPEFLIIETALLVIIAAVFVITWIFNRKKYHNYEHQIPAGVMKSYLDSIIQNSVSLKSSLFRGGGLENIEASSAQVLPLERMRGGDSVAEANPADQETINRLKKELDGKTKEAKQLASQVNDGEQANQTLRNKIKELEDKLKNASSGAAPVAAAPSGDDGALRKELADVTKERDELKARLKEYEIIEDDLANLKRLQQENEQLKKALGGGGGAPAAAAQTPPPAAPKAEPEAPKQEAAAAAAPATASDDGAKSPEDLLSEFEKMLG
jgi:hypothetical protein